ncbi:hypothetical protein D3C76_1831620 [compost metagenome]
MPDQPLQQLLSVLKGSAHFRFGVGIMIGQLDGGIDKQTAGRVFILTLDRRFEQ